MDSISAFANGEANRGKEMKVFDWVKASEIIKEKNPQEAIAGLSEDMEWTSGVIYCKGKPYHDSYTYLASTWATPILEIDGEEIDCYKMESEVPAWSTETKWPDEALKILGDSQS